VAEHALAEASAGKDVGRHVPPATEPEPEPAVKPIVVGAEVPGERKRGWWRR
jgi:hypothetical protein